MKDTSFESTGPFGGNGGFEWDDGIYTTIRTLIIWASSVIESIQIEYDDKGRSKFSNKHGESESGAKYMVELDYPSEYIRLITGRYGTNNHDMIVVLSLKIESNKKEYGPFGDKEGEGNSFEFPSRGNKIIGFHGSSNSHLISIGAYFLPIPDPIESISIEPVGGLEGSKWDDGKFTTIRKLILSHSSVLGSIQIEYDDKGLSKFSNQHGRTIGTQSMVELDYPDEFLISVWGYISFYKSHTIIESIAFESNKRKYGPFGAKNESYFKFPSTNGKIIGFYGRSGRCLDSLGGYYQPISNPGEIVRTEMFGGWGGSEWDDGAYTEVKRLIIYCSGVIESIQIHYDNNQPANVHGIPDGKRYEVELDYPREHLISVSGYTNVNGATVLIQSLTIESNKRTYGPFGIVKETYFQFPSTSGKIIGFHGRSGFHLDAIGAYIEPNPCQSICISPFGGQGGIDWDDGVHSTIRKGWREPQREKYAMGAMLSSLLGGGEATADDSSSSSSEPSRVIAFHSSDRWQLHYNAAKELNKLIVVDFAASWCGPCKFMEPAVHAMAAKFTDVDFAKIDVDELSDVAQEFAVQGMPTFVLLKQGKEVDRIVGAKKDELEKKIQKHREVPKFAA